MSRAQTALHIALLALAALGILTGLVWANTALARRYPVGKGEFLATWTAARAFLAEGRDPYGDDVARQAQTLIYGHPAGEGERPYRLTLPFYLLPLFFPFALTDDPILARGLWLSLSEIALLTLGFAALSLAGWTPQSPSLALFLLVALLWTCAVIPMAGGSLVILHGVLIAAALLALRAGQDELAGALLALATFRWGIGGIPLLFTAVWAWSHRRGRVFATFGMTLAILLGIAFILYPSWLLPFLRSVVADRKNAIGMTMRLPLVYWWPEYGRRASGVLSGLLAIVLFLEWRAARRQGFRHFYWVFSLSLTLPPLIGSRATADRYALLILPLTLTLAMIEDRWERVGKWLNVAFLLATLIGGWALFQTFITSPLPEAEFAFLFLPPLIALSGLYWSRWWSLRPPRTWLDRARQALRQKNIS